MEPYKDPIIRKYVELIESRTKAFRAFYYGDPILVPTSLLPCCIIEKQETRVGPLTNASDEHGVQMTITVITDIRKDLSDHKAVVAGISSLYDLMEGRESDLTLKPSSVLGILRGNLVVDAANGLRTDLSTMTRIDYGRSRNRDKDAWSTEAVLEFVAHFSQVR